MHDLFTFISQNIHVAGWTSLVSIVWKLSWKASKFFEKINNSSETIDTVATNHLPHIQAAVEELNEKTDKNTEEIVGELKGIRQDLLTVLLHKK